MRKVSFLIALVVCLILVIIPAVGQSVTLSRGQIVYAPASHTCMRWDSGNCIRSMRTGLSIRNIDLNFPITLISIQLYDPDGNLIDELLDDLNDDYKTLAPLTSIGFNTDPYDLYPWPGGRLSFIVKWKSSRYVNAPIIESSRVLLDASEDQLLPLTWQAMDITTGTVLREAP